MLRRTSLAAALLTLPLGVLALPAALAAGVSVCTYDATAHDLTIQGPVGPGHVAVANLKRTASGGFVLNGDACDAAASVTTVDRVVVAGTTAVRVALDEGDGTFEPGLGAEAGGTAEIEFAVRRRGRPGRARRARHPRRRPDARGRRRPRHERRRRRRRGRRGPHLPHAGGTQRRRHAQHDGRRRHRRRVRGRRHAGRRRGRRHAPPGEPRRLGPRGPARGRSRRGRDRRIGRAEQRPRLLGRHGGHQAGPARRAGRSARATIGSTGSPR